MSNRFPVSDEQVIKPKNTKEMKKALEIIEATEKALENYNTDFDNIRLRFTVTKKEIEKFCKQENIILHEPDMYTKKLTAIWNRDKIDVFFSTKELKVKSIIFEDEN